MTFTMAMGTLRKCIFGLVPTPFLPIPSNVFTVEPVGSMLDIIPFLNVMTFGICITPTNPMVDAIMIASLGTVDFAPCIPIPIIPKTPAAYNVLRDGIPMAQIESFDLCLWGGLIMTIAPSQFEVMAI